MRQLRAWFLRLGGLLNKERRDSELTAEMESHLQMHIDENLRAGMSPVEARRQALIQLGGLEAAKEQYRERRGVPVLEHLIQDLRYALRVLRKNPGFTTVAVLTLALGIGANTLIFSLVDSVVLKPLLFDHPERLVQLNETFNQGAGSGAASWLNYQDWTKRTTSFQGLVGYYADNANLQSSAEPQRVSATETTANLFDVLGVKPRMGRGFLPGEDSPGARCVTVLSDRLWRRQFAADPNIVGQTIKLNGGACSVIGIAPASFEFPVGTNDGIWIPLQPGAEQFMNRGTHFLQTVGRLKDGVSQKSAEADLKNVMQQLVKEYPTKNEGRSASVLGLHETISGSYRQTLAILFAAVGCVLLLACVNVGNMMMARATSRRHEIAIRTALGATKKRLVRQLFTESFLLALLGAGAGMGMAAVALRLLDSLLAKYLLSTSQLKIDGRVMMFALAASVLTTILFGLTPALHAVRETAAMAMRGTASTVSSHRGTQRFRQALIAFEVGISFVLLIAAVLLTKSLVTLYHQETGMQLDSTLTFKISPPRVSNSRVSNSTTGYEGHDIDAALYRPLLAKLRALPGVKSAGMINILPLDSWGFNGDFEMPGHSKPADVNWSAEYRVVSPEFYSALGVVMLQGHDFSATDTMSTQRVAIVNDTFAKNYLASAAIGQQLAIDEGTPYTIIGVYRANKQEGMGAQPDPEIDLLDSQVSPKSVWSQFTLQQSMAVVIRSPLPPDALLPSVRSALHEIDPTLPLYKIQTMGEIRDHSLIGETLVLVLIGSFAALALLLALIGLYGVMSYYVAQRTREIGIRIALGAQRQGVLRMVLGQGAGMSLAGVALGVVASLGLTRAIANLLFGIKATDPLTFVAVAVLLLLVALASCYLPARRAMKVDPIIALRHE